MPELPDISVYIEAIKTRIVGQPLESIRLGNPFLLRTADPPISNIEHKTVVSIGRLGKRIVFKFEGDLHLVLHLMIAGRLHWKDRGAKISGKYTLAALDFPAGTLTLTEAGTKRRASFHLVQGSDALADLDPGGIDVLQCTAEEFAEALRRENHTLKRSLTDPRLFSGIGNSYSDEILFDAMLSPVALTQKLNDDQVVRLHDSMKSILQLWTDKLIQEAGEQFPENVTAFRPDMAVHGRYEKPCPRCGSLVQRIRYADNETNYCPQCQTAGKLLSDRALSRLLGSDWPKTLDALELMNKKHKAIGVITQQVK